MLMVFAIVFIWTGLDYRLGSAAGMGPGYFPMMLSILLLVIGTVVLVKGFLVDGPELEPIAWKPLLIITISIVMFGLLLMRLGLVISLLSLLVVSAAASTRFRFGWPLFGLAVLLLAFCYLVFVIGLGIPLPIVGNWLQY
jgi:hypothetical protein